MPFAKKFRAMIDFPFAGDRIGDFLVEEVDVRDVQGGSMGYIYGVHMVLRGPGGQTGVRRALKKIVASHPLTFSSYGNPYQLWFRKPTLTIESLGEQRYAVQVEGAGVRIYIEKEFHRFLDYLEAAGVLVPQEAAGQALSAGRYFYFLCDETGRTATMDLWTRPELIVRSPGVILRNLVN